MISNVFERYFAMHRVIQSESKSFWGDVVLDSFNNASRYEDKILDQIYTESMFRVFIMMILNCHNNIRKGIWVALKPNFYEFLVVECAAVFL